MKLLVAVDGSVSSLKAVEAACDLAKAQPSSVILMQWGLNSRNWKKGGYIADKMKAQAEAALVKAKDAAQAKASPPR